MVTTIINTIYDTYQTFDGQKRMSSFDNYNNAIHNDPGMAQTNPNMFNFIRAFCLKLFRLGGLSLFLLKIFISLLGLVLLTLSFHTIIKV